MKAKAEVNTKLKSVQRICVHLPTPTTSKMDATKTDLKSNTGFIKMSNETTGLK